MRALRRLTLDGRAGTPRRPVSSGLGGTRRLLSRGRARLRGEGRDTWDRLVASDPGLARLRKGSRAVVAVGSTIGVQLLVALALGVHGQARALHLLLGSLLALNMSTVIRPGRRREVAATGAWAPVGAAVGAVLATLTAPSHWFSLALFVAVCAGAVWVRRFGGRWYAAGFITWQAYFFTLYLHPPMSALPGMLLAIVVSAVWVTLLLVTLLHQKAGVRLRRTVTALRARARSVVSGCLDVLRAPGDARQVRQLRGDLVKLSEVALLFDGQLGDLHALPSGASPARLRHWIVEMEISAEELANASVDLAEMRDRLPAPTARLVREVLQALGWADRAEAAALVDRLRTEPHNRVSAVRRLANGADAMVGLVSDWFEGRLSGPAQPEEFEQVLSLVGDNLPGTAVSDPAARPDRRTWSPHTWRPSTWSTTSQQSVQAGTAAALAIVAGELISPQRFYWAVIAAFVAFTGTATVGETVRKSLARILGTVAGLVVAVWVAELTGGHPVVTLVVLLACIFCAFYLQALSYAAMIFFITLMLGELYGILNRFNDHVLLVRLAETHAGAAAGIMVALFVLPTSTRETLVEARRTLLERLSVLLEECATRLRGEEAEPGLLGDAIRLDEAARQLARNAESMVSVRGLDRDRPGRRQRVHVLGVCASTARSLVPAVLAAPERSGPQLAQACDAISDEAHRLAQVPDLRDQTPRPDDEPDVSERVSGLLDAAPDPPVVLVRRIQRLADSLAVLTPR